MRICAAILALMLGACAHQGAAAPPGIVFPTHPGGSGPYPAALLDGTLEVEDGCVYLTKDGERWLGLWPASLHVEQQDGRISIVDESGIVVGVEGQRIVVGGGERRPMEVGGSAASRSSAEEQTDEEIPTRCGAMYWLVSGVESGSV
jgi:hypothetical protein